MWPQIVVIALMSYAVLKDIERHGEAGKPIEKTVNCWTTILAVGIHCGLLYWGGFWEPLFR